MRWGGPQREKKQPFLKEPIKYDSRCINCMFTELTSLVLPSLLIISYLWESYRLIILPKTTSLT